MRHWFKQADIDPSVIAFLNAAACFPDKQENPTKQQLTTCRGWVHGQLEIIRPQILLTMGRSAFYSIRRGRSKPSLAELHGSETMPLKPYHHPVYNFTIVSTYHPASYLRGKNKSYEEKITRTINALAPYVTNGHVPTPDRCFLCEDELYRYDEHGIGRCQRHAMIAGELFPEGITI